MTDGAVFDFSEILSLAADLGNAPRDAGPKIHQAIEVTSRKVKDAWAKKLEGTPDVPHGSRSIGYDIGANVSLMRDAFSKQQGLANTIYAEIGAEDGKMQAPIVAVLEYGAPSKNLPPHGYGAAALQENNEDFQTGLEKAIGDPLK